MTTWTAGTVERSTARLDRALEAERAARVETTVASLHLLCLQIRAAAPDAALIVFEWSDQGDWLSVRQILDFHALEAAEDWDDPDCLASNFTGDLESIWSTFMMPMPGGAIRRPTDAFYLGIDMTLTNFIVREGDDW